jgi:hypothetical protein
VFDSVEQRDRARGGSYVRLFEAVPGALLEGTAPPGAIVTVRLPLVDNLGASLAYQRAARADASGRYQVRVAYPTSDPEAPVVHPPPGVRGYALEVAGQPSTFVDVPVEAVRQGKTVRAPN